MLTLQKIEKLNQQMDLTRKVIMPIERVNSIRELAPKIKQGSLANDFAKTILHKMLSNVTDGRIVLTQGSETTEFGEAASIATVSAHVDIHNPEAYAQIMKNGITGAAEAYMLGMWTSQNLTDVVRVMVRNLDQLDGMKGVKSIAQSIFLKLFSLAHSNNIKGSKRNISAHYDLGNEFFKLFLDETMMYSSAVYPTPTTDLTEAATYKLDLICQKLQLSDKDHVVEIGTGWGGFACFAAKHYGCKVTTTTISKQQYLHACEQVKIHKLEDKVTVLDQDYRLLEGQYDKLVSIEMIEAVGYEFYPQYFDKCSSLLKPNGQMLIQAILMNDQRYEKAKKSIDFIKRYIFPGGCLPSYTEISKNVCNKTDLQMMDVQDITYDYALTLADWRKRFLEKIEHVEKQGYNDIFIKMWEFYLCYCQGGFMERSIHTAQIVFAKPKWRDLRYPIT